MDTGMHCQPQLVDAGFLKHINSIPFPHGVSPISVRTIAAIPSGRLPWSDEISECPVARSAQDGDPDDEGRPLLGGTKNQL